jgi:2-methylcitrate dehydratase PrpD
VVFPAAMAAAQDVGCSGEEFLTACVVGYEVANRVGEFLGMKHYHVYLQFRHCANKRTSTQRVRQEHLARPPLSHGSSN